MSLASERSFYKSDGGILWTRFPIFLFGSLLAGIIGGGLLALLYVFGFYLIVLAPMFVALLVGLAVKSLCWFSHCRNSWIAVGIGFIAGLTCYPGNFYFQLLPHLPRGMEHRIDIVPQFIHFRMMTDVIQDPRSPNQNAQPLPFFNYLFFIIELVTSIAVIIGFAWAQAHRFYSPLLNRWMNRETFHLASGSGEACIDALENNTLSEFLASAQPPQQPRVSTQIGIDYAAGNDISTLEYPLYLTVEGAAGKKGFFSGKTLRKSRTRGLQLRPDEVLIIFSRYPKLKERMEHEIEELRNFTPTPVADISTGPHAEIEPIEEGYRNRIRTKWYPWIETLISLIPFILLMGGLFTAFGGAILIEKDFKILGVISIAISAPIACVAGYLTMKCPGLLSDIWNHRRLVGEVRSRPNPIVPTENVSLDSFSLIPIENFMIVKLTLSDDLLLMYLDHETAEIRLEGDSNRYWIPVDSVADCSSGCFYTAIDSEQKFQIWVVRLLVRFQTGYRELLLSLNQQTLGQRGSKGRRRNAERISQKINDFRTQYQSPTVD